MTGVSVILKNVTTIDNRLCAARREVTEIIRGIDG